MRAKMPAMINKLMPLPMPNSSICSPSHIKKIVPAVIVITAVTIQKPVMCPAALRNSGLIRLGCRMLANQPIIAQLCPRHKTTVA